MKTDFIEVYQEITDGTFTCLQNAHMLKLKAIMACENQTHKNASTVRNFDGTIKLDGLKTLKKTGELQSVVTFNAVNLQDLSDLHLSVEESK
jgi:hypothetical protein